MARIPDTNAPWDVCLGPMDFVTQHGSLRSTSRNGPCPVVAPSGPTRPEPLMPWLRYPMGGTILLLEQDIQQPRPRGLSEQEALDLFERVPVDLHTYFALIETLHDEVPHPLYGRYYGQKYNAYPLAYILRMQALDEPWTGAAYVARYLIPLQAWACANRRFVVSKASREHGTSHLYGPCIALFDEDLAIDEAEVERYLPDSPVEGLDATITRVSYMTFCALLHKRIHNGAIDRNIALRSTFVFTRWFGEHFMPLQYDFDQVVTLAQNSQVIPEHCTRERLSTIVDYVNNAKERTLRVPKAHFAVEGIGNDKIHYAFRLPVIMQHIAFGLHPLWTRRHDAAHEAEACLAMERTALFYTPRKVSSSVQRQMKNRFHDATGMPLPDKWWQTRSPDVPLGAVHGSCMLASEGDKPLMVHDWQYGRETFDWLALEFNHLGRLWWLWQCRDKTPQGHESDDQPWIELYRPEDRRAYDCVRFWQHQLCAAQLVLGFLIPESLAYRLLFWADQLDGSYRLPHVSTLSFTELVGLHQRMVTEHQNAGLARLYARYLEFGKSMGLTASRDAEQLPQWFKALGLVLPSRSCLDRYLADPLHATFDEAKDGWVSVVVPSATSPAVTVREPLCPMAYFHGFVATEVDAALVLANMTFPLARVQGQRPVPSAEEIAFQSMIQRLTSSFAVPLRKNDKKAREFRAVVEQKQGHWDHQTDIELACVLLFEVCTAQPSQPLLRDLIQTLAQRHALDPMLASPRAVPLRPGSPPRVGVSSESSEAADDAVSGPFVSHKRHSAEETLRNGPFSSSSLPLALWPQDPHWMDPPYEVPSRPPSPLWPVGSGPAAPRAQPEAQPSPLPAQLEPEREPEPEMEVPGSPAAMAMALAMEAESVVPMEWS